MGVNGGLKNGLVDRLRKEHLCLQTVHSVDIAMISKRYSARNNTYTTKKVILQVKRSSRRAQRLNSLDNL